MVRGSGAVVCVGVLAAVPGSRPGTTLAMVTAAVGLNAGISDEEFATSTRFEEKSCAGWCFPAYYLYLHNVLMSMTAHHRWTCTVL